MLINVLIFVGLNVTLWLALCLLFVLYRMLFKDDTMAGGVAMVTLIAAFSAILIKILV